MPSDTPLHIEVAYAEPGKQRLLAFQVACGTIEAAEGRCYNSPLQYYAVPFKIIS